jgi:hypothetical protein
LRITLLGVLALTLLVIGVLLLVLDISGAWTAGAAEIAGRNLIFVAVLLALATLVARKPKGLIERLAMPAKPHDIAPVGPGRIVLARASTVVALLSLAGGSALLAAASILGDDIEERVWPVMFIWPPTFLLAWAFGSAAFAAKRTLDPAAAAIAFFAGLIGGWLMLAAVMESQVFGLAVLAGVNIVAIYFVRREFWAVGERHINR